MKLKFILLFLIFSIISKAQVSNAPCNDYSPWISPTYSMTVANQTGLFGDTWSNKNNVIDNNIGNASSWTAVLAGSSWIESRNVAGSQFPAGSYAGFVVGDLDLVSLGASMRVSTYLDNTLQEQTTFSSLIGTVLDGGKRKIGFVTTKNFNRIRLTVNAGLTLIFTANAYYAEVVKPCAGVTLPCNTSTPITRPGYGAIIESSRTGLSGVSVGTVSNVDNVVNSNTSDYATLSLNASILGSASLSARDLGDTFTAGTFAGFDIENANLVAISAFSNITISTYLNGVLQEQKSGTSLWVAAPLLDFQNRFVVGFETTKNFNEVQITISQPLGISLGITNVYGATLKKPCEGNALVCNTPTSMIEPNYPININSVRTGVSGIASAVSRVNEPDNVIDSNTSNYATLSVPVTAGTIASLSVLKSLSDYPAGTFAGFDIQNVSLLNAQFLQNITLRTYNNGVLQESVSGNGILLGAGTDLLASDGRAVVGIPTTKAFDELQISLNNVLGVDIGNTRVYKMVATKPCAATINCNSSYYLTQPNFPVVLNAQRTGLSTLVCAACSVNNPDNVIDSNLNNYSRITLAAGVGNNGSISVLDPTATFPKGTFAGFVVKDRYFLVQGDLLEFITIKTYNKGVLQESKTSTDLIDLSLLIPIIGTGNRNIGFYTTKDFDEIQIQTVSIASVINVLDVFAAFIDTRSSNGTGLSCIATLVANPDAQTINAGSTGTVSVLANDTYNGGAVTTNNVTLTQNSTTNSGVNINTSTGLISVAAGTPAGTYTVNYTICDKVTPSNCKQTTATVTVPLPLIDAVTETFPAINGANGGNTTSVLANDTLGGQPATTSNVNLTAVTVPTGLTLNPDGTLTVAPNTPAGNYNVTYKICDKVNPTNCDTVTSVVVVSAPAIDAVNDTQAINAGQTGSASVLGNDTLNGSAATLSNVNLTQVSTSNANVTLNTTTGLISVAAGTPAGTYTVNYRICDKVNPTNCDTATATVTVAAPAIDAVTETFPAINGANGGNTTSVLANDTLGGQPATTSNVNLTAVTVPTGLTLNPDGTVTVAPNTPAGNYNVTYKICDKVNPSNCDTVTSVVVVSAPVIDAVDDAQSIDAGQSGSVSVLNNDTLNGAGATLSNVSLAQVSTSNANVTLNTTTGLISVAAGTPAGTYTVDYRICDKVNPTNCDTATATITVAAPLIDAVTETFPAINGGSGGATTSVLSNDTLGGQPATAANVNLTGVTVPSGLTLNPDGTIAVAPNTPAGNYDVTYKICDKVNPSNCDTVTSVVVVSAPAIVANPDNFANISYVTGGTTPSVLLNDTLNGQSVNQNNVNLTGLSIPTGFTLNADGTITVAANTAAGTYSLQYTICDKINVSNCSTATATVIVSGPVAPIAVNDTQSITTYTSGTTGSTTVLANDIYNGGGQGSANINNVNITNVTPSNPKVTINPTSGLVTVASNTPPGTYTITYVICDKQDVNNCSNTATASVQVSAPDLTPKVTVASGSSAVLINGVTTTFNYIFTNSGTAATSGAINVFIYKPVYPGTFTVNQVPAGWSYVSDNGTYITYTTNNVLVPGQSVGISYDYIPNNTNTGLQTYRTAIVPNSGGETVTNNNVATINIMKQ